MDGRRFDGFARSLAHGRTRRGMLRGIAALTGLSASGVGLAHAVHSAQADADGTGTAVGGTDGTGTGGSSSSGVCVPVARSVSQLAAIKPPFPAQITAGSCETPDLDTTYALFDVAAPDNPVGAATAAAVFQSVTTVRVDLDDLLKQTYSISVRVSESDETVVACGEIGGLRSGDDLTVGIRERNGSNYTGTAWLRGNSGASLVYLFLGRGLSTVDTASATKGSKVVTTADVNLRAAPSEDADIVAVLAEGTELTVTGTSSGDWVPVKNDETGDVGYVAAQYLLLTG